MARSPASAVSTSLACARGTARTGDILADEQAQAARKEDVLGALSQIATRFRTRLGESLATVEKHSTPLEEATTASLEALKAYSAATEGVHVSRLRAGLPLFERAIAIDPDFAIAHAQARVRITASWESRRCRAQSTTKAYQLRHRASDAERFFIEMLYDRQVTGNMDRELETLEAWAQTYPRDSFPHGIAGRSCHDEHRANTSCRSRQPRGHRLDPDGGPGLI